MSTRLRANSLSFFESLVMGVAGSGPANGISLALGALIGTAGMLAPVDLLIFAIPMLGIAFAYKALNKRSTHAGAAYNWVGQSFGKFNGFMAGWALITAQMIFIIVGVTPLSTAVLDFINPALVNNVAIITALSVLWFLFIVGVVMAGIKLTSYMQIIMTTFEIVVLFAVGTAAFIHVHALHLPTQFSWHVYTPAYVIEHFSIKSFAASSLIVVFLYWGWDVTANLGEETKNGEEAAGNGGLSGVLVCIFLYSMFAVAALMLFNFAEVQKYSNNIIYQIAIASGLGRIGGLIALIAVVASSIATVQTGMLQVTRTMFAMGRDGALPRYLGTVSEKTQNPTAATNWLIGAGLVGILLTGFMPSVASILNAAATATGLQVAYYFGMAGLVSAWVFRHTYRESIARWLLFSLFPGISAIFLMALGLYSLTTFNATTIVVGVGTLLAGILFFRPRRYTLEVVEEPSV